MIQYLQETWKEAEPELRGFWQQHYDQLSVNKEDVPLDMWNERYSQLDESGILFLMTVRDMEEPSKSYEKGKLIGYFIGVVQPHLHFKSTLHYFSDLYYIDPSYRGHGIGKAAFQEVESRLKQKGVKRMYFNTKKHENHSDVFEKLGFKLTDYQFSKII